MDPKIKQILAAIKSFKDWSNYLLVTTVAALGWVTTNHLVGIAGIARAFVIGFLGSSIVFGIFTLDWDPTASLR